VQSCGLFHDETFVDCSSRRMCVIICSLTFGRVLFINVYVPFKCDEDSIIVFQNELNVIRSVLENNDVSRVIIDGVDWVNTV